MALTRELIQWTAGMAAAGVLVYMSYLSLRTDFTLSTPVILGMLGLILLMLYGKEPLIRLVHAYRGTTTREVSGQITDADEVTGTITGGTDGDTETTTNTNEDEHER